MKVYPFNQSIRRVGGEVFFASQTSRRTLKGLLGCALVIGVFSSDVALAVQKKSKRHDLDVPAVDLQQGFNYTRHDNLSVEAITAVFSENLRYVEDWAAPLLAWHLIRLCQRYKFDPALILAVIQTESAFNPRALSPVGARGLMQVMPATALDVARRYNIRYLRKAQLFNPFINLSLGVAYLSWLRERYEGKAPHYLAAYNAGPRPVDRMVRYNRFRPRATKPYIEKVLGLVPKVRYMAQCRCGYRLFSVSLTRLKQMTRQEQNLLSINLETSG